MPIALRANTEGFLRTMGRLHLVRVLGTSEDTFWVTFPGADYPVEGMAVDLEFHEERGFYIYHTRVVIGPRKPGDGIVLRRTESLEFRQHRREWRVPVDLKAGLLAANNGRACTAQLLNLGSGGAMLRTPLQFELGDMVQIRLQIRRHRALLLPAQVIRIETDGRFALRFIDVPASDVRDLIHFVWERIRETYPGQLGTLYPRGAMSGKRDVGPSQGRQV